MGPPKASAKMYYFRGIILIFWIVVITIISLLYIYVPDIFENEALFAMQNGMMTQSLPLSQTIHPSQGGDIFTSNTQQNEQTISQQPQNKQSPPNNNNIIYHPPKSPQKQSTVGKFIRSTLQKFSPSKSDSNSNFIAEPYHDPKSRCHLPVDPNRTNPKIQYTNKFPFDKGITVEQIIAKRSEPIENIPMCPNADKDNFDKYQRVIDNLPSNLLQYVNRCQINAIGRGKRQFGGLLSGDPLFPQLSTQVGFLHVYKSGGTTVRDTMNNILPGLGRTIWHSYRGHIREFMSHLFMFSHVRDPVSRSISSYFELHRRNESDLMKNNMVGIDSFRFMLNMMQNRMDCKMANKEKAQKMHEYAIGEIYFNMHIMPQMYFLTEAGNPWISWPVNWIGNMTDITPSVFEIIWEFYWNTTDYNKHWMTDKSMTKEEARKIFEEKYHHGRDRHKKKYLDGGERVGKTVGDDALRYQIEMSDLSDDDIRRICDVYWMDYICIPFPMPKACNLTELLLRHYGDDVVYKDCWNYDTKNEWDPIFKDKYLSGQIKRRGKDPSKNGAIPPKAIPSPLAKKMQQQSYKQSRAFSHTADPRKNTVNTPFGNMRQINGKTIPKIRETPQDKIPDAGQQKVSSRVTDLRKNLNLLGK